MEGGGGTSGMVLKTNNNQKLKNQLHMNYKTKAKIEKREKKREGKQKKKEGR